MRHWLLLLLFAPIGANAQWKSKVKTVDSVLQWLHERQQFNGSVLLAEKGKIIYQRTFGIADTSGKPLTPQSAFNLASVSKQFFTMMAMILHEEGKLDYDAPVQQYLPTFPYNSITVRQLMNHTSGLPEYFDIAAQYMTLIDTLDNDIALAMLAQYKPKLVFQPGEKWEYCNTNYTTLASIIAKLSGKPCDVFFKEKITQPLGLSNTYIYNLKMPVSPANRVFGFRTENSRPVLNDLLSLDGIVGDGNIYSTAQDLLKWDQSLYTEKLVKKATLREAFTPGKLNNGEPTDYGFGWSIEGDTISHSGGWVGFGTFIQRLTKTRQTLIFLSNGSNGSARGYLHNILKGDPYTLPHIELIQNAQLIDGTGSLARNGSLRIVNNRIFDLGDHLKPFKDEMVTNAEGLTLSPGFIDSHSHLGESLVEKPDALAAVSQGITTIISGQDGGSNPIDTLQKRYKQHPAAINMATYTGFGSLREKYLKEDTHRAATDEELSQMKSALEDDIKKGALGLSTGLEYEEEFYSSKSEVIELAKTASAAGGRYISHIRSEDVHLEEAIEEIIEIGREAKIPVQISHVKIAMSGKWNHSPDILARLEMARTQGVNITADCYPYTMWASTPRVLFPKKDFTSKASAQFAVTQLIDPVTSVITWFPADKNFEGKTITAIGQLNNESPADALLRIINNSETTGASIVGVSMAESDISNFLRWNYTNICSDGGDGGHPRGYGAFTRVLGKYVREDKIMPLETAIYKMTGLTASQTGIPNRGLLTSSYYADLLLFDPVTVKDNSSINDPKALSSGISKVWVNGQVVFEQGKTTGKHPGQLLRKPQ